jgi:hypothetical protein
MIINTDDGKREFHTEDVKYEVQAMIERFRAYEDDRWVDSFARQLRDARRHLEDFLFEFSRG